MALPGLTSPNPGVPVDPDNWPLCASCLHEQRFHVADGCAMRDNLGNRCACVQEGP